MAPMLLLLCLAAKVYAFTPASAYYAGSLKSPERKVVPSIAAGRPGAVAPVSWKGTRRVGTVPGMRPTMNQQQLPSKTYTKNKKLAEVTLRFLQREMSKAKSQVRSNLHAAAIDTTTIFSHQHKVAAPVEPVPDSRLLTLNGLGSYSLPSVGVLEKSKSDGTRDEYTQMNVQFAEYHQLSLPLDAAGKPAMPGFYLFEDYQQLFQNVDEECEEDDLDVQGSLPSELNGVYFVNGPGILRQKDGPVHPFDGHGLIRRFDMVGKEGRVHFRSRFVRTSAFRDEHAATTRLPTASRTLRTNTSAKRLLTRQTRARKTGPIPHPCSHAPVEGQADPRAQPRPVSRKLRRGAASCFPVLHRGIGTNVKIRKNVEEGRFGEFLFVQRNPSNTCVRPIGGDRLMSLYEGGLPLLLNATSLETLGEFDLGGRLRGKHFLAHTRYDSDRNLLVGLAVSQGLTTTLEHVELDPETLQCVYHRRHTFNFRFYVHDFCITPHSLIVLELKMERLVGALCGLSTFVSSLLFSKHGREGPAGRGKSGSEHQRLCIIPRRRPGEWGVEGIEHAAAQLEEACVLEMEGTEPWCGALHHVQAHEEADGESISMSSCVFRQLDLAHPFGYTPPAPIFHCESHPDGQVLSHVRINLAQHRAFISPMLLSLAAGGRVQEQEARHELVCDFPATAPSRDGKECRFVYAVTSNAPNRAFPFQVLAKVDLLDRRHCGRWQAPAHCFFGEPVFVPRPRQDGAVAEQLIAQEEDDGWLLVCMYATNLSKSSARSSSLATGASASVGRRRSKRRSRHGADATAGKSKGLQVSLLVFDAKRVDAGPLAQINVGKPFPMGFHTSFSAREP